MNYHLIIYGEAHNAIDRNADWWFDNHSPTQAEDWLIVIYSQIASLSSLPNRCPAAIENSKFDVEIKQLSVGKGSRKRYRVIFTIVDDTVHVLSLLDGAQDKLGPDDLPPLQSNDKS